MKWPKRLVTTLAAALAPFLPHSAKPSAASSSSPITPPLIIRDDHIDDIEIDWGMGAAHRTELDAKYTGLRTTLDDQLATMANTRGKGLRYVNSSLRPSNEELHRFITERMRDDV